MKCVLLALLTVALVANAMGRGIEEKAKEHDEKHLKTERQKRSGYNLMYAPCVFEGWVKMSYCIDESFGQVESGPGYLQFMVSTARRMGLLDATTFAAEIPEPAKDAVLPTKCIVEGLDAFCECSQSLFSSKSKRSISSEESKGSEESEEKPPVVTRESFENWEFIEPDSEPLGDWVFEIPEY